MATVKELLAVARKELGVTEAPAGSNKVKYSAWYGLTGAWCVMFVQWVFQQAGVGLPARTASCTVLMNAAKKAGCWVMSGFRPGDVVIYDWGLDGKPDHCGIVAAVSAGKITAIEGNTAVGNDSNGGEVMERTRSTATILGAVRPVYEEEKKMDNHPSAAHKEGVAWAVANGILTGNAEGDLMLTQPVTRQQMCTMLYRFMSLGKQDKKGG